MTETRNQGRNGEGKRAVTQRDVALRSGVTQATVSMVINNDQRVRPETRTRVLEAVRELGYVPNLAARGLASRRSQTLAIVAPDLRRESEQFLMPILQGLVEGMRDRDYFLNLSLRRRGEDSRSAIFRTVREKRLDGLFILSPHAEESTYIDFMADAGVPFVLVNRQTHDPAIPCVYVDHEDGARMAVEHLINRGHRRIACIAGPERRPSSEAKLKGYRVALEKAGLAVDPGLIMHGDFQVHGGLSCMRQLLRLGRDAFTAVYAGNDFQALGAIQGASECGIAVPGGMAVIGCDDWEMAAWVRPSLSTIRVPFLEMGIRAADLLCRLASDETVDSVHAALPLELVARESA